MISMRNRMALAALSLAAGVASFAFPGTASAALSQDLKCQAAKNKVAGAYYACRQKAETSAIQKGVAPDYAKCIAKFTEKWDQAEAGGEGLCPDEDPLAGDMEAYLAAQSAEATARIAGNVPVEPTCGDGSVNVAGEHCDGADLDAKSCASFGMYGDLACTGGCDFDVSGCTDCPDGSFQYEDLCWVLGALGANCDTACSSVGLVYDDATATVAGSLGTDADCLALLYTAGAPGGELDNAGGDCPGTGIGCAVLPDFGFRARCGTPATNATDSFMDAQRICACH